MAKRKRRPTPEDSPGHAEKAHVAAEQECQFRKRQAEDEQRQVAEEQRQTEELIRADAEQARRLEEAAHHSREAIRERAEHARYRAAEAQKVSHAALETADIILMADDLGRLPWLIRLSRATLAIIRQNIILALATKAIVLALAVLGRADLWMAIAADVGTTLVVIANSLRLLRRRT